MMRPSAARLARATWWYRVLLVAYPAAFRNRFRDDLTELFNDAYAARAATRPLHVRMWFWLRILGDTARHATLERLASRRGPRVRPIRGHDTGGTAMARLLEDIHHALRALRTQRGVSVVVILTLALAIGANSAVFTVVNAVLLRPLPYLQPDRIMFFYSVDSRGRDTFVSVPDYEDWREALTTITGLSVVAVQSANLTGMAEPDRLRGGFVTAGFFHMLGVQPIIGRAFLDGEDAPNAPRRAVLDYGVWQRRFGGDPSVVGRTLILNNIPHDVIGVLPPSFEFPIDAVEVWMPLPSFPASQAGRDNRNFWVLGRVPSQVAIDHAAAELKQVTANLAREYPQTNTNWTARFVPIRDVSVLVTERNLQLLWGAIGVVLLIACANIANLLLTRAAGRQREMAVRAALGASRSRLIRQLLVESVVLAACGGGLGLLVGGALTDAMLALAPTLPRADRVAPDLRVVGFTAALTMVTGLLVGILPALRTSRPDLRSDLSDTIRGGDSRGTGRLRATLVVVEIAMSVVLVIGAGLLIQSLHRVLSVEIGYDPDDLLTLEYRLPRNKYDTSDKQWAFHRRALEQIASVPGIEVVALARAMPQSGNGGYVGYWRAEESRPPAEQIKRAQFNTVSSDYFSALRIPLREGRSCTTDDNAESPVAVIVNQFLAEREWPGTSAIGQRLRSPDIPSAAVVIGVVGNTRPQLLQQPIGPQIYACLSQQSGLFATVIARTATEPMALARSVQQAVWSVDPDQPMWKIRSGSTLISGSVTSQRFVMVLMSCAAGLALILAGLGTYSVLSYAVQRRAREMGVRMALGATRGNVMRLVLAQTIRLTAVGVVIGLVGAMAASRVLAAQLFEISPRDPITFASTPLLLAVVALIAAWLPVRRATSVDPMLTLRAD